MQRLALLGTAVFLMLAGYTHAQSRNLDIYWALADPEHNTSRDQIANVEETADCKGNWIKASIAPDGAFTITNGRNGFTKKYAAR